MPISQETIEGSSKADSPGQCELSPHQISTFVEALHISANPYSTSDMVGLSSASLTGEDSGSESCGHMFRVIQLACDIALFPGLSNRF